MTMDANGSASTKRFVGNAAASLAEIDKVQQSLRFRLPKSYVEFMLSRNGGEGLVGRSYLVLWKIEELVAMNDAYHVAEFAPGLFLLGTDGGGEAFGFDTRSDACRIVSVPFVEMEIENAEVVAPDFGAFFSTLSNS